MAVTNHDRVGKALEVLKNGLKPIVEREMKAQFADQWTSRVSDTIKDPHFIDKDGTINWDVHNLLMVMWDNWHDVFRRTLGQSERSLVGELRETRNNWAHQRPFTSDDAYRALDSVERLLTAVSAEEARDIGKQKLELLRTRFDEQRRSQMRKTPLESSPMASLKPWREIVTPHPDVASGQYQQAQFAADLWQVFLNEGSDEYKNPTEFFRRTFLTEGLKTLLISALKRLNRSGGDPVVELQTNFGGGKTHSMLALYHLFSGKPAPELPGTEELLSTSGTELPFNVTRAVFVGTQISPGKKHEKPDGTVLQTLWGEIAWQLGGKEGYAIIKEADQTATNPGDSLRVLFNRFSPCLILIDEWVGYARQLHDNTAVQLPAGTFDTQFTFAQALTEAAKAAPGTMVVISIPSSENEAGGDQGKSALARLKNIIGRIESPWRPASQDESYEIVRRRLFQPIIDNERFIRRDAVARAFSQLYSAQPQEFPSQCKEADYERRIKAAYPIHPELFDRLYSDWSTLDKFHRTRGVLRLMAAVIHSLWERSDNNLLILPATVPIEAHTVQGELTHYLEDQWVPVIEKDVDGPHSLPLKLDRENPNLGRYSACRRVARTIYIGSAPTIRAANKGIDERQVKLGCVQPGESAATFGDSLRRLTDRATYLYLDGSRYWYSTQPTVTRLAEDRASRFTEHDIYEEISRRLQEDSRSRGDFSRVHTCVPGKDIPDEPEARLVILGPNFPHSPRDDRSPGRREAQNILDTRGTIPRNYRNTLVFLAADANRLKDLESAVRLYMAWNSIIREREELNLDPFQSRQAETKCKNAGETIKVRIPETFQWLIVPAQPDPKGDIRWEEMRIQGQDALAVRVSKKLGNEDMLFTRMGGVRLRLELDRIPLWRGHHAGIKQLAEDFARYLYLPRLKDSHVLTGAIRDGIGLLTWQTDTFAYAESCHPDTGKYRGLRAGQTIDVWLDDQALIVRPDMALKQIQAEKTAEKETGETPETGRDIEKRVKGGEPAVLEEPWKPRRFHATVPLDAHRIARDAGQIADEVVQHLTRLEGAQIDVSLEIQAYIPQGAPDEVVRTITENLKTLEITACSFEEE